MEGVWLCTVGTVLCLLGTTTVIRAVQTTTIDTFGGFLWNQPTSMVCWMLIQESDANDLSLEWTRGTGNDTTVVTSGVVHTVKDLGTQGTKLVQSNLTLTIQASDNNVRYTCTAYLGQDSAYSYTTAYVITEYNAPRIYGPSIVLAGSLNISWVCFVEGASYTPSVQWRFTNNSLVPGDIEDTAPVYTNATTGLEAKNLTSVLTLNITEGAPDFSLKCIVTDNQPLLTDVHSVQIAHAPEVTVDTSVLQVQLGNTAILECTATATPDVTNVTWYKDDVILIQDGVPVSSDDGRISGSLDTEPTLVISTVVKGDAGGYVCNASNDYGYGASGVLPLVITYGPSVTYGIYNADNPVVGVSGYDAEIPCIIDAEPDYTNVYWYRVDWDTGDETPVSSTNDPHKYSGGTLTTPNITILNLSSDDAGLYRCVADNDIGRGGEDDDIELEFFYGPGTPYVTFDSFGYNESEAITLKCNATGNPAPDFRWYKDGSEDILYTGNTLSYANATPEMTGEYMCEAYNTQGSANTTVDVEIFYRPRPGSLSNVTASVGDTKTLTCATSANPTPTVYSWVKDGQTLTSTARTVTLAVEEDSFGRYECVATNERGDSDPIYIWLKDEGDDGGSTGESTDDIGGLSIATLILLIIICLVILIVIILFIIFCYASGRCRCIKKDNDVAPSVMSQPAPAVMPITDKPPATVAASMPNGHLENGRANGTTRAAYHMNMMMMEGEEKRTPPTVTNGRNMALLGHGLSISLPGDNHTPRPYHLPPLGQDGVSEETESAREDKPKKRKRRRRRQETPAEDHPENEINV